MTEVALLRGPTNLASTASRAPASPSPSPSSSLRYLANADSDVLQGSGSPERTAGSVGSRRLLGLRGQEAAEEEEERWSFLALLFELLRKSLLGCRTVGGGEGEHGGCGMEIGLPTDVQHVAHVTFDRFHGFLGLPVEFEPEVPRRAPSARNRAEGIFRINAENSQEEFVRDQLNSGIVPDGIDVHCLAGLIKMADPLTALMYAVQVMNFLKMLVQKTLKDREESTPEDALLPQKDPSDENGHQKPTVTLDSLLEEGSRRPSFAKEEPLLNSPGHSTDDKSNETNTDLGATAAFTAQTSEVATGVEDSTSSGSQPAPAGPAAIADASGTTATNSLQAGKGSRSLNRRRTRKGKGQSGTRTTPAAEKSRGASIVSRINSRVERIEAWR
ncbi:hypothetical protein Zm00014a_024680 [Zea mays]|uniref:CRIB domain-containing protein n=1 Tax=Zea mays TaxID=4577 RepID=A0A3L6GDU3_MAIZE|nr:hypothetical protein Zm00014a_024680 [Zea mays]